MSKIAEYINEKGNISFKTSSANELDRYIFTCIGKLDYSDILGEHESMSIKAAVDKYVSKNPDVKKPCLLSSAKIIPTLVAAKERERFKNTVVSEYVNYINYDEKTQFSALTIIPDDEKIYVTFRGTDDTFVGWEENFLMASESKVYARESAVNYLTRIAKKYDGKLAVIGHSKGGNLAVYAASNVPRDIQNRIEIVESYDGPGFLPDFLESDGYINIRDRIITYVSEKSIVGMIMDMAGTMKIVKTKESGIATHDALSWEIDGETFAGTNQLSKKSIAFRDSMKEILKDLDSKEREAIFNDIFNAIYDTKTTTLTEFGDNSLKNTLVVLQDVKKSKKVKRFIRLMLKEMIKNSASKPNLTGLCKKDK